MAIQWRRPRLEHAGGRGRGFTLIKLVVGIVLVLLADPIGWTIYGAPTKSPEVYRTSAAADRYPLDAR